MHRFMLVVQRCYAPDSVYDAALRRLPCMTQRCISVPCYDAAQHSVVLLVLSSAALLPSHRYDTALHSATEWAQCNAASCRTNVRYSAGLYCAMACSAAWFPNTALRSLISQEFDFSTTFGYEPSVSPFSGSDLLRLQLSLDRNARYEPDALFLAQLWHVAHFNPQAAIDF